MKLDLVDVFGAASLRGNPLGVVHGGETLSDAAMLAFTQWLGFSETTFLLPPTDPAADYALRIFYAAGELPFAGHPTLGSCHAWLQAGGVPKHPHRIMQQCGAGLIEIRRDADRLAFAAPAFTRYGPLSGAEQLEAARIAGVPLEAIAEAVHVANGPKWQLLRLRCAADVLAAKPVTRAKDAHVGLAGPTEPGSPVDWEVRALFSDQHGAVAEDPVTGSLNAGIACHLFATGLATQSYVAGQGQKIGADGRVYCSIDADGRVWIGGRCDAIATGAQLRV